MDIIEEIITGTISDGTTEEDWERGKVEEIIIESIDFISIETILNLGNSDIIEKTVDLEILIVVVIWTEEECLIIRNSTIITI